MIKTKKEQHEMLVNIHAACQRLVITGDQSEQLTAIKNSIAIVANAVDDELKGAEIAAKAQIASPEQAEKALKVLKKLEQ